MRLSVLQLILAGAFCIVANARESVAQELLTRNVTLRMENVTLQKALSSIEKQTGVRFAYSRSLISMKQQVSIRAEGQSLQQVLDQLFQGRNIEYQAVHDQIMLKRKRESAPKQSLEFQAAPPGNLAVGEWIEKTVKGRVSDEKGEGLPGVSIVVKGSRLGTVSDIDGSYELVLPDNEVVLIFSFVGFVTQEVEAGNRTTLDITLKTDQKALEEVVVVGYGTQQKREITGAVKQLGGEELSGQASIQTSAALMGKVPGVQVIQSSGQPGQNQGTIRIRGAGTLGNSNPLILIDGIPGSFNNIPSTDIESITVLKDAAAAAVYGSRAANGVILVTTKRGSQDGVQISYNGFVGWQRPTTQPEFVDGATFMKLQNEGARNLGMQPVWTDDYIRNWEANHLTDPDNYPSTDWVREAFSESGLQQRHTVNVSGGSAAIRFLGSLSFDDENSNIRNYGFKRYSIRLNTDIYASKKIDINFDINLVRNARISPSQGIGRILVDIYRIPAVYVSRYSHQGWGPALNLHNPIAYIRDGGLSREETTVGRTRLGLNYRPLEGLTLKMVYSPEYQIVSGKTMTRQYDISDLNGTVIQKIPGINGLSMSNSIDFTHNLNAIVQYQKSISEHRFGILGGYEFITFNNRFFNASRDQFQLQNFEQLNAGSVANQLNNGSESEWALQSLFGRINYDFKSRYFLEGNLRYDGSSRFTRTSRWGTFPSFSVGWLVSEETFMRAATFISSLKIRGSWGILGNQQIGTYPFASTVSLGQNFIFGGVATGGAAQLALANPGVSWEKTTSRNAGIDVALLNNRLNLSADLFDRRTSDILLQLPVPLIMGLSAPFQNAGEVKNSGWEMEIGYRDRIGKDFHYNLSFNVSDVKNRVTNIQGVGPFISGSTITSEGAPIGAIFGYQSDGLFKNQQEIDVHAVQPGQIAPGDIRYVDQNNDGVINADDRVIVGDPFPSLNYGINLSARYKDFDLGIFLQGIGRRDVYLSEYAAWPLYNGSNIKKSHAEDYWTPENPGASMPRFTPGTSHSNFSPSDFWVYNASYLRLRNLQIGYTLSPASPGKFPVKHMRFYMMGENLLTLFSKMPQGIDPNVPNGSTYFPLNKLISLGINVNF